MRYLSVEPVLRLRARSTPAPRFAARSRVGHTETALALRALLLLAVVGFSLAAAGQEVVGTWISEFVAKNALSAHARNVLLVTEFAGALGAAGSGLVAYLGFRRRRRRLTLLVSTARLLAPAMLAGLARPLLAAKTWDAANRIAAIALFVLATDWTVRLAAGELARRRRGLARRISDRWRALAARFPSFGRRVARSAPWLVGVAVAAYGAYMGFYTVRNHRHFMTMSCDLGQYDNAFYNALHGHPFLTTPLIREGTWSSLRSHAEFSMYALLPFYAVWPRAETLLVLQTLALASGGWALYRFASRRLPHTLAATLALAYLAYPPLHEANFYDVHFQTFGAAFTLWSIDFLDQKKTPLFALFFALALGCREDIAVGFVVLGFFLLVSGARPRAGALIAAIAASYFCVVKFAVMPHFGTFWYSDIYKELYPEGEATYAGVVKTLLTNPIFVVKTLLREDNITYLLQVTTPLAFLPMRRGVFWLSLLPGALFTLLTTAYPPTVSISFQYVAYNIPYFFAATALVLSRFSNSVSARSARAGATAAIVAGTFFTTHAWGALGPGDAFKGGFSAIDFGPVTDAERQKDRDLRELAALVPRRAALAVSEHELPHVSGRRLCYDLKDGYDGADYILFAEGSSYMGADNALRAQKSGEYLPMASRPGLVLLERKR